MAYDFGDSGKLSPSTFATATSAKTASAASSGGFFAAASPYVLPAFAAFEIVAGAQQAETIRENAQLQKRVSDLNAGFADLDAYNAEQAGYTKSARYQEIIDKTVGAQRTAEAANNVDVNFGTAAQLQQETKLTGFLNQLDIKQQASMQALGYKNQAANIRLQGIVGQNNAAGAASTAQTNALLNAGKTLVSGYTPSGRKLYGNNAGGNLDTEGL